MVPVRVLILNSCCYLDEWENFLERLDLLREGENRKENDRWSGENELELRHWASTRGQTLFRTGIEILQFKFFSVKKVFKTPDLLSCFYIHYSERNDVLLAGFKTSSVP